MTSLFIFLLFTARALYVNWMYGRALAVTSATGRRIIQTTNWSDPEQDPEEYRAPYVVLQAHSIFLDTFNFTKWTYNQFFPDIAEA